jgi:hypothetical protein
LAWSLTACSALIDTGPYLGGGQDGGRDAGRDGEVPSDAPTTPVVRIAPEGPRTDDVLEAVIQTESTDPLGAGAVVYEYRWLLNGEDAGVTVPRVEPSATSRGQTWRVEVTPVSADGARRGLPGSAEVVVGNSPPTLSGLGLDRYRPVAGETIATIPALTSDPDGDAVTLRFEWLRNGTVIDGQTSSRLDLSRVTVAPGDSITVRATPRDASMGEGPSVTAGPAIVLEDITRWRQLLPDRAAGTPTLVAYDPANRRALLMIGPPGPGGTPQIWEYALDDTSGRFVQLFPGGGDPPLLLAQPVYDARRQRILLFGGVRGELGVSDEVWALDVSRRGQESWSVAATGGPGARYLSMVAYDEERDRVLCYGGVDLSTATVFNDLWAFDLAANAWVSLPASVPGSPVVGAGFVVDPTRDRALLVSGGVAESLSGEPVPSSDIFSLDLATSTASFELVGSVPRPAFFPIPAVDVARGRVLIAFGFTTDDVPLLDAIALDLATLAPSVVMPTGTLPPNAARGFFVPDRAGFVFYPGGVFDQQDMGFQLYRWSGSDEVAAIHRTGVDLPGPRESAMAVGEFAFLIYGGSDGNQVREDLWELSSSGTWRRLTTSPDAVTGRTPGPRAGVTLQGSSNYGPDLQFFGGRLDTRGTVANGTMWLLRDERWIEQTLLAGTAPTPREGAAFFNPACGAWRSGYFGGVSPGVGYTNDTGFFECAGVDRECQWTDPVGGSRPPARAFATTARFNDDSRALLYGGEDGARVFGDVWTLFTCGGGPQPWQNVAVSGTAPPARSRHSMTLIRVPRGELESLLVFGGASEPGGRGTRLSDVHRLVRLSSTNLRWDPVVVASGPNDAQIPGRHGHVAFWDTAGSRLLVYGGVLAGGGVASDFWELRVR